MTRQGPELLEDELEPPEDDEPGPPEDDEPPDVVSSASALQNPSTGLQVSPSQQLASSLQARARSPASTHEPRHTNGPIVAVPGSYGATQ